MDYIVNFNATDVGNRSTREQAEALALEVHAEAVVFGRSHAEPFTPEDVGGVLIYHGDELVGTVTADGTRVD